MSRYRLCTFFLVLPTSSELCPRAGILESRPWIISDQESPFAEGSIGPRSNLRKELSRSSRDILWTTGAGPRSSLGSRSPCLGHSVLPLPCEHMRLSMGFLLRLFFPVQAYKRFIWVSVQASFFLVVLSNSSYLSALNFRAEM